MALDIDILGQDLFTARETFNNRPLDDLVNQYGDLPGIRLAMAKEDARVIIEHIINNAVVPAGALIAPNGAVTGQTTIT